MFRPIYEPRTRARGKPEYTVYIHIFPNGKKYIGLTKNCKTRFRGGSGYLKCPRMYRAIEKYGWGNVEHKIIADHLTEQEAKKLEIEYIRKYQTTSPTFGYNLTFGGEGGNGRVLTEGQKEIIGRRMSLVNKGKKMSEEQKALRSRALKGKPKQYSPEGRKRIIESNHTRKYSLLTRAKMSENTKNGMQGKNMSQYLSSKWNEDKEDRIALLKQSNIDRYGGKDGDIIMKPIYKPSGRAAEYGEFALNIYSGCPHKCFYCYAPKVLHVSKEVFHSNVIPRPGILEATKKQLKTGEFRGKTIFLCFTADPYPALIDTTPTREVIQAIKNAGAHVQILTKGGDRARRDFDLLDSEDSFGITLTGINEPMAAPQPERARTLLDAAELGIKTWVSFEPVIDPVSVLTAIATASKGTLLKIGKLNHYKSDTDWKAFGLEAERICKENGWNYYIKEDLRAEMER